MRGSTRSPGSRPIWRQALIIMAFLQMVSSFIIRALPVIGPEVTTASGAAPHDIGILAGAISAGTMWFLLSGSLAINYCGPVRILQIGALMSAAGVLLGLTASWWLLVLSAFLIGVGYGPSPPAASELLVRTSPPNHRSLIMSIKQAGVPLGGALAGLLLPAVVALSGWRAALLATAAIALAGALVVQPWRELLDADRDTAKRPTIGNLFSRANLAVPFRVLREIPGMLPLTLAVVCFACTQGCVLAFFVTQLTSELGFSLAVAGAAFSAMQVSGTFSRVIMGWVADRLGSAKTMLLLALLSTAMVLVLAALGPDWPAWLVMFVGFAMGTTSISWNGVFLAEAARIAPLGRIGDATSGSTFFLFIAYAVGPFLFSLGIPLLGGYGVCFAVVAFVQVLAAPALLLCIRLNP
ncbi:Major facilitator superfamily MFS_1 [uncultured delta proteobacterium]|uniref:Major facilitator superfamily MFS_1 n=1 Tax=uncultured delta proteobacterium TaxID=34034 RepID=A0A212JJN6_9DELT|nr:Major facilitator superfamily MFS_1 [uncultured delta proteobacterium]